MATYLLIRNSFQECIKIQAYWKKWISNTIWIEIIKDKNKIPDTIKIDERKLNASINKDLFLNQDIITQPLKLYR